MCEIGLENSRGEVGGMGKFVDAVIDTANLYLATTMSDRSKEDQQKVLSSVKSKDKDIRNNRQEAIKIIILLKKITQTIRYKETLIKKHNLDPQSLKPKKPKGPNLTFGEAMAIAQITTIQEGIKEFQDAALSGDRQKASKIEKITENLKFFKSAHDNSQSTPGRFFRRIFGNKEAQLFKKMRQTTVLEEKLKSLPEGQNHQIEQYTLEGVHNRDGQYSISKATLLEALEGLLRNKIEHPDGKTELNLGNASIYIPTHDAKPDKEAMDATIKTLEQHNSSLKKAIKTLEKPSTKLKQGSNKQAAAPVIPRMENF